jgi:hypothetical protein
LLPTDPCDKNAEAGIWLGMAAGMLDGGGEVRLAKQLAKDAFNNEAGNLERRIIRDRTTGQIKGVGAGNASYRPKGGGSYSVTGQNGIVQHFRP